MRALLLVALFALAGGGAAMALESGQPVGPRAGVVAAGGDLTISNSRQGEAIFGAAGIAPGDSAAGTVEIANTGAERGELVLSRDELADTPGLGNVPLSARLSLLVLDVTAPTAPVTVYAGALAAMAPQPVGVLGPGETRRYELVATLPQRGGDENAVQGARVSVGYTWTAREATVPPMAGASGGGDGGATAGSPPTAAAAPLTLRIKRVARRPRHGRLLVWARCNRPCRIGGRARFLAQRGHGARTAARPQPALPGTAGQPLRVRQLLRFRLPARLMRLSEGKAHRLQVRLALHARDGSGASATAKRQLRLRYRSG